MGAPRSNILKIFGDSMYGAETFFENSTVLDESTRLQFPIFTLRLNELHDQPPVFHALHTANYPAEWSSRSKVRSEPPAGAGSQGDGFARSGRSVITRFLVVSFLVVSRPCAPLLFDR